MRKLLLIAGGVVLLLVAAIFAIALLVDVDRYRPEVEKQASAGLGRQVTIGKLKLALLKGGISAENLAVADDPQFSNDPFLTAGSMNIGVDLNALIFSRKLNVRSFLIHAPKLNLVQNAQGQWNYSTLANSASGASAPSAGAPLGFAVGKFTLDDGNVAVHHLASGKTSEYTKLSLEASDVSLTSSIPYEFSAAVPGGGTVDMKGTFGPVVQQFELTPMNSAFNVKNFDVAATGFSDPGSPLKGLLDVSANLKSDGTRTDVDASITGNKMCLAAGCMPSRLPIAIHLNASYLLADRLADLSNGQIKLGSSTANLSGKVDLKGPKPQINATVDAPSLAVNDIEGVLPALGIILPSGARLQGGTATLRATATGPADAPIVKGHVHLVNSKLTGYDLGSQMTMISKLSGATVGKETVIQQFDADVQQSPAGTRVENILLVLPGIGRLTGAGTIGQQNELNFAMKAQVQLPNSMAGGIGAAFGSNNTSVGVPFHITGTTKDPKFTPDTGNPVNLKSAEGLAGSITGKQSQGITDRLGGLFGKKK